MPAHRRCNSHNSADGASVGEGTGAECSTTLETSEPQARDAETDGGYYSPDPEDDPGCSLRGIQLTEGELDALVGEYSSVSEDNEQRELGDDTGCYTSDSDDDAVTGYAATSVFTWVSTQPRSPPRTETSEEDENDAGDDHYSAADGSIQAYK